MVDFCTQVVERPWMSVYLRFLALIFAYGALAHLANIAGLGEKPWLETPLSWRIGDVCYAILDIAAVIGLWQHKIWGIGCFLVAVTSQLIIYTLFINEFASTAEQRQTIYSLLGTEVILVLIFAVLLLLKK